MDAIAQDHPVHALWRDVTARLAQLIGERGAHPSRTVVLLPYAQLMPVARQFWAQRTPSGFAPRFETTMNWSRATEFEPAEHDISFDTARDLPAARAWLVRAGLAEQADVDALAPAVLEAAWQLAGLAAAVPPAQREAWAAKARAAAQQGMDAPALRLDAAIGRIAVEWAAASAYASDALFAPAVAQQVDLLVILQGLQAEPLHLALQQHLGAKAVAIPMVARAPAGTLALHQAADAADEAHRAAACVLRHVEAGRVPVALGAIDRVLTRQVAGLLHEAGATLRDETGWKLSTTRAAGQVMALLRAAAWDASSDQVLDWLKHTPAAGVALVSALERRLRRAGLREWRGVLAADCGESQAMRALLEQANAWRTALQAPRSLAAWLPALREVLQATGQWPGLERDAAGQRVLDVLRLHEGAHFEFERMAHLPRRLAPHDFVRWADAVLEAASFVPEHAQDASVVLLPFSQMLGRPFAALVLAGCDEQRLPASPEPGGSWTAAQRKALGLPSREALQHEQRLAWEQALQAPRCDLVWRTADDNGEPLLASPLLQALQLAGAAAPGQDPCAARMVPVQAVQRPQPQGAALPPAQLSASAYEDLRRCPYRFFALRQLGLQEAEEVEGELGKRDFGTWLHKVLRDFHEALRTQGEPAEGRAALLDRMAREAEAALRATPGEFLPFTAGWAALRDGYLRWLQRHEATGARFVEAEAEHTAALGSVTLVGRIDRVDAVPEGGRLLLDYKTESAQASRDRMKQPLEDTQLAFYAALMEEDAVRAAYLNVGERGDVLMVEHPDLQQARALLRQAIRHDLDRIAAGAAMPALGEGRVCDFCAARGLCRRDGWA